MVRLYNHTRYDDLLLREIFNWAARILNIKGDVPVKLTHSDRLCAGGFANRGKPYRKTLIGKPTTSTDRRLLKCPTGWIEMHLPRLIVDPWHLANKTSLGDPDANALKAAEWFVDVAIHEMRHIYQFRNGLWLQSGFAGQKINGRRTRHDSRPCEIDAENAVFEVHENRQRDKRRQELVLNLAIMLSDSH